MRVLPLRCRPASRLSMAALASVVGAFVAGCATGPGSGQRDGPEANPPPGLADVPDAEPRVESIRSGGPNKPYEVLGRAYVPITQDAAYSERGLASWYGRKFQGKRTSSGELYNMYAMTAAHPTLPIPSYARIRNPANGREVVVRVNDRGPFHSERIVDLSYTAALKLDLLRGVAPVELERITYEDIRTGAWRRAPAPDATRYAARDAAAGSSPEGAGAPSVVARATPSAAAVPAGVPSGADTGGAPGAAAAVALPVAAPTPPVAVALAPAPIDAALVSPVGTLPPAAPASSAAPEPADAPPARAWTESGRGFWVQLGAFRQRDGAETFQRRVSAELDWIVPLLTVFSDASLFRLQAGPYASRDEARNAAVRIRDALQLVPVVVERR